MWQNIKIAGRLLKINILNGLMYRGDFWLGTITEIAYLFVQLLFINFIFEAANVDKVAGFTLYQIYFVGAIFELVRSFAHIFIVPSAGRLWSLIHYGKLDTVLLKPRKEVFILFNNSWITDTFSGFIFNFFLIYYIWPKLFITADQIWLILFICLMSLLVLSAIEWITTLVNFYSERLDALNKLLFNSIDLVKYPKKIYPRWIQNFYIFVFPIFLIANPVYQIMEGTFGWEDVKIILAMTVFLSGLTWFLWRDGLKRYVSAN